MKEKASVIIVSFNTKKLTMECINSVIKYGGNQVEEIIVVDNGSKDGSFEALRARKDIKLIKNNTNLGFSKANNQAIDIVKGRYILLLNSDTVICKGALTELIRVAEEEEKTGVVVPQLLNPDGTIQGSVFRLPSLKRAAMQYWFGKKGLLDKYYPKSDKACPVESAVMAAFLITPAARKRVGKLDEKYFMYYEDLDFCRRTARVGLKIIYVPKAQVIHYHGESGKYLEKSEKQWKRLIPSSKIYHGTARHYLFNFILRSGQKWERLLKNS